MAKRTDTEEDSPKAKSTASNKKLLVEMLDGYKKAMDADRENRSNYRDDMRFIFIPGEQWDQVTKKSRGNDRVMYEFNELRVKVNNTINQIRANRPSAKIRGVEDGDKDKAEIYQGICLNSWNNSDGDSVTDYAALHQVAGGMGAMRVTTKYTDDNGFNQDLGLEAIRNPLCLLADAGCQDELKRDAVKWWLHTKISKDAYKSKYKDKEVIEFTPDEEYDELDEDDKVWICEYWRKEPVTKVICQLSNGMTVEKGEQTYPEGVTVVKERVVKTHKIVQYICSKDSVLEGPNEWAGSMFPFVIVYGNYIVIDGKPYWYGLGRHSKDSQRAKNVTLTAVFETIFAAPQAKYMATAAQMNGHLAQWNEAITKNFPALLYNPDPKAPGPPIRIGGAEIPAALMQAGVLASEAIKETTGIFSNLDELKGETSGRAIGARAAERSIATYNFGDNISKAVRRVHEIWIDLIPKVIDTERTMRILGKDGSEKYIKVNQFDPMTGQKINDLSEGKMDVVVTQGPSYATQRQEAFETYTGMMQANPMLGQLAGDLIAKSSDLPYSDAIAERLRMGLPPVIQQQLQGDKPLDPAAAAALQQADQAMQQVQMMAQEAQKVVDQATGDKSQADKAKADVQVAIANLKVQEAQLATDVANFKTLVAETQLKMAGEATAQNEDTQRAQDAADVQTALGQIQEHAATTMQQFAQQMTQIMGAMQQPQVVAVNQGAPRRRTVRVKKVNGEYVGEMSDAPDTPQGTIQ